MPKRVYPKDDWTPEEIAANVARNKLIKEAIDSVDKVGVERMQRFLGAHPGIEQDSEIMLNLLSSAARSGNLLAMKHCASIHPAILQCRPEMYLCLSRLLAKDDYRDLVPAAVELGFDINARFSEKALEGLASDVMTSSEKLQFLLEQGYSPNTLDHGVPCSPALVEAVYFENLESVKVLVEHGAAIDAGGADGVTPLGIAHVLGFSEIEEYLRSRGAREYGNRTTLYWIRKRYGKPDVRVLQHIVPADPPIRVHRIDRSTRFYNILVTEGMSDHPMPVPEGSQGPERAELVLTIGTDWPLDEESLKDPENSWPLEWLLKLARLPVTEQQPILAPATIIANGDPPQPLGPETAYVGFMLLPESRMPNDPYVRQEVGIPLPGDKDFTFFRVFPLYAEEIALEKTSGIRALLEKAQEHHLSPCLEINRVNVVTKVHLGNVQK